MQAQQGGPGRRDQGLETFLGGLLARVDPFQVGHQLGGDPFAVLAHGVTWADLGRQDLGLSSGEVLLGATGQHSQQDSVQLGWSCGCAPHPSSGAGPPAAAGTRAARSRPRVAARPPGCRPARPSAHRWRPSCGPARWRTPGPERTAWPARPGCLGRPPGARWAMCRPMPSQPLIAHTCSGQAATNASIAW